MKGDFVIGIDIGTSAIKAGVYRLDGTLASIGRSATYEVDTPHEGWAEVDSRIWWDLMKQALATALTEAGISGTDVAAVGLSVLFPAVIPLGRDGDPLGPAILYNDRRSIDEVQILKKSLSKPASGLCAYEDLIGNLAVPGTCGATSLQWIKSHRESLWKETRCFGAANTYLVEGLTGETVTDPTNASFSGLVDIRNPTMWAEPILSFLDLGVDRLPAIREPWDVSGRVSEWASGETGLAKGTPVACGTGDSVSGCLGAGVIDSSNVAYVTGSTDCVLVVLDEPTDDRRWLNCAGILEESWVGIGSATSTGASVDWAKRELAGGKPMDLEGPASRSGTVPIFLPYLQGERTPHWDPRAKGVFFGITSTTTQQDLLLSVLEGTAFALRDILECSPRDAYGRASAIRATGGGTRNGSWNQIKSDVLQKPLDISDFEDTSSLGAAMQAAICAGAVSGPIEAAALIRRAYGTRQVEPSTGHRAYYDERFRLYQEIYRNTRDIMTRMDRTGDTTGGGD